MKCSVDIIETLTINNTFCFDIIISEGVEMSTIQLNADTVPKMISLLLIPMYWRAENGLCKKKYYAISEEHLELNSVHGDMIIPKYHSEINHDDSFIGNGRNQNDNNEMELSQFNIKRYCETFLNKTTKRKIANGYECIGVVKKFKYIENINNAAFARWTIKYYKLPRKEKERAIQTDDDVNVSQLINSIEDNYTYDI